MLLSLTLFKKFSNYTLQTGQFRNSVPMSVQNFSEFSFFRFMNLVFNSANRPLSKSIKLTQSAPQSSNLSSLAFFHYEVFSAIDFHVALVFEALLLAGRVCLKIVSGTSKLLSFVLGNLISIFSTVEWV